MNTINPSYQKAFNIYQFSGEVAESGKNLETRVSGGGGGGSTYQGSGYSAPVSITSQTVIHDQLFLINSEGKERSFQLQDFNLACRKGNNVTVYWYIREGKSQGSYFGVINHSTDQNYIDQKETKKMFLNPLYFYGLIFLGISTLIQLHIISLIVACVCGFFIWKMKKTSKKEREEFLQNILST
ncbi:hypothetical protein [Algoriphagus chordae]|uniref:Uncharacterized protein n=1 Tax=Algoriphagus chordae TaxID=237019 RepID=A0A2W7QPI6_9BACT|nr:hypothetical protein [Algoriphagus chordae]PZX49891.1 hypothetical protein LV85_02954 [Algoriphagus chordae]